MTKRFLLASHDVHNPHGGFGDIKAASDDLSALKGVVSHDAENWEFSLQGRAMRDTHVTILDTVTLKIVATWVVGFEDWIMEERALEIVTV